ncbi:MAG: ABC transporter ATP-binding protein [Acidimicrobiales bacterium]
MTVTEPTSTSSATAASTALSLRGVAKRYADPKGGITSVLEDLSLDIADGEFLAILGFSGSGKTTLVSLMAGLIEPDDGVVEVRGEACDGPGRDRGVVFQNYSLMPWLDVEGNVRLAVDAVLGDLSAEERQRQVDETIDLVGLSHAKDRKPAALSGGMRQRVAVARALSTKPEILLLDEPLSALDALTRSKLQDEIEEIRAQGNRTIVLVTNDVDEALLLADRVAVLEQGPGARIERIFDVDIARPRQRTELNHDENYKQLRNEIINYLDGINGAKLSIDEKVARELPKVLPVDLDPPPKVYQEAQKGAIERRYLEFFNLTKVYPTADGPLTVLDGVDLIMDKGEFISLIGHSGCGKSTALTMAAGLNSISGGGIVLDGREVTEAGPDKAVVFQAPSLMPWLTARDNVAMGVERVFPDASAQERTDIVEYYLDRVGLGDAMDKRASELSNGMKQRVGLARAFALSPKLLLLDEPFGMLDSLTRWDLQDVLIEVWNRTQVTAICVTHDVDEAILLADKVVMMTNGPNARIGKVLEVDLPRPRDRKKVLADPKFYEYREEVLAFLEEYEHGAHSTK